MRSKIFILVYFCLVGSLKADSTSNWFSSFNSPDQRNSAASNCPEPPSSCFDIFLPNHEKIKNSICMVQNVLQVKVGLSQDSCFSLSVTNVIANQDNSLKSIQNNKNIPIAINNSCDHKIENGKDYCLLTGTKNFDIKSNQVQKVLLDENSFLVAGNCPPLNCAGFRKADAGDDTSASSPSDASQSTMPEDLNLSIDSNSQAARSASAFRSIQQANYDNDQYPHTQKDISYAQNNVWSKPPGLLTSGYFNSKYKIYTTPPEINPYYADNRTGYKGPKYTPPKIIKTYQKYLKNINNQTYSSQAPYGLAPPAAYAPPPPPPPAAYAPPPPPPPPAYAPPPPPPPAAYAPPPPPPPPAYAPPPPPPPPAYAPPPPPPPPAYAPPPPPPPAAYAPPPPPPPAAYAPPPPPPPPAYAPPPPPPPPAYAPPPPPPPPAYAPPPPPPPPAYAPPPPAYAPLPVPYRRSTNETSLRYAPAGYAPPPPPVYAPPPPPPPPVYAPPPPPPPPVYAPPPPPPPPAYAPPPPPPPPVYAPPPPPPPPAYAPPPPPPPPVYAPPPPPPPPVYAPPPPPPPPAYAPPPPPPPPAYAPPPPPPPPVYAPPPPPPPPVYAPPPPPPAYAPPPPPPPAYPPPPPMLDYNPAPYPAADLPQVYVSKKVESYNLTAPILYSAPAPAPVAYAPAGPSYKRALIRKFPLFKGANLFEDYYASSYNISDVCPTKPTSCPTCFDNVDEKFDDICKYTKVFESKFDELENSFKFNVSKEIKSDEELKKTYDFVINEKCLESCAQLETSSTLLMFVKEAPKTECFMFDDNVVIVPSTYLNKFDTKNLLKKNKCQE